MVRLEEALFQEAKSPFGKLKAGALRQVTTRTDRELDALASMVLY